MTSRRVTAAEVSALSLCTALDAGQRERVAASSVVTWLPAGATLFHTGDPVDRVYYLRSGQIKLSRLSVEGEEHVVAIVHPGQSFAEAVLFLNAATYPVTAQSIAESELIALDASTYRAILRESVDTCFRVMANMSLRLHELIEHIEQLTLHNATYRLVNFLLDQLPDAPLHSRDVHLTTPKSVVASRLAIQPETFSRILKRLQDRNLIRVDRSTILLHDIDGLRALVRL